MINYDLSKIKAVMFDVDGVLSCATVSMDGEGQPMRTLNIKDGYAIRRAVQSGLGIAIITGGKSDAIRRRYGYLGVEDIIMGSSVKVHDYEKLLMERGLKDEEVIFVGDDIPDYEVMKRCGCACCPKDACAEIKKVARYVSGAEGGHGVARDVLEQVLMAQGKWLSDNEAFGW